MKPYHNINVTLSLQACGTQWLMILQGKEEDIKLVFNGFWNLMATGGEMEWLDHTRTSAKFWSTASKMYRFFFNQFIFPHANKKKTGPAYVTADIVARQKIAQLQLESERFFDFNRQFVADSFNVGTKSAERPDSDFRDAVLVHAYKDKTSVKEVEKELANK